MNFGGGLLNKDYSNKGCGFHHYKSPQIILSYSDESWYKSINIVLYCSEGREYCTGLNLGQYFATVTQSADKNVKIYFRTYLTMKLTKL